MITISIHFLDIYLAFLKAKENMSMAFSRFCYYLSMNATYSSPNGKVLPPPPPCTCFIEAGFLSSILLFCFVLFSGQFCTFRLWRTMFSISYYLVSVLSSPCIYLVFLSSPLKVLNHLNFTCHF